MIVRTSPLVWICLLAGSLVSLAATALAADTPQRPLKIYILVGQSNMQGHAMVKTFPHIGMDPKTAPMLKDMTDENGNPRVLDNVWISEIGSGADGGKERHGKLDATYGVQNPGPKIGPEYTFGIYMAKHLNEPILIIKTAWGGKSLNTDFRPPSAGDYVFNESQVEQFQKQGKTAEAAAAEKREQVGVYYRLMMEHVKKVLADPARVCPAYDPKAGYEIAGFVWFQGWNDMVDRGTYPNRNQPDGYAQYSEVMAHFIRDVRKDLNAPKMPFVIGVLGVGGPTSEEIEATRPAQYRGIALGFRRAMAAPADMPEFKGNVAAVWTDQYWDMELDAIVTKYDEKVAGPLKQKTKAENLNREQQDALRQKLISESMTEQELKILETGKSNAGYHYLGSAKILGGIGKGFAEAMIQLQTP
jgi:alpha-galactosidase